MEAGGCRRSWSASQNLKSASVAGVEAFGHRHRNREGLHLRGRFRRAVASVGGCGRKLGSGIEAGRIGQSGGDLGGPERSSRGRCSFERAKQRGAESAAKPSYVLRTMNGGGFWDDITANLPDTASAHGVTADRASGAIYVATDAGVFFTATDLGSAGRPTNWTSLSDKPAGGRGHRREVGRGRQPDLCGAGWIRSVYGHRSASAARCAGGKRGGLQRQAGGAWSAAERAGSARGIGLER